MSVLFTQLDPNFVLKIQSSTKKLEDSFFSYVFGSAL